MTDKNESSQNIEVDLQDLVIEVDSGARRPVGWSLQILFYSTLIWSVFQIWIASPLPYTEFFSKTLAIPVLNSNYARYIHLSFGLLICFISFPAFKTSPRSKVPITDWLLILCSVSAVLYLYIFRQDLAVRAGLPTKLDIALGLAGLLILIEAGRRALGIPLILISIVFLFYCYAGSLSFMPDVIAHKGQSIKKIISHQWLTTEGVFGIAIGVSTDFVFLFVLFGALLDKAGAGNYFINLAFSLMGHFRGGPAKAAVLASGLTGMISGSSIANVVTTGTFTVPLMRKVGFSREKAGAVEVSSSVNGQLMPPVMGAAAFLMIEYVNIPYTQVVKAAFIPAIVSYIGLLYIVHLEALKSGIEPLKKNHDRSLLHRFLFSLIVIISLFIIAGASYFLVSFIKSYFTQTHLLLLVAILFLSYLLCLFYSSKFEQVTLDDDFFSEIEIPKVNEVFRSGLHYTLPILVLIWCLMVERLSPGLSAFWATIFMIFIVVTQKAISNVFRKTDSFSNGLKMGLLDLIDGLTSGGRNMAPIAIATATAGIIVGSVSLTGFGLVLTDLVEKLAGGSFILVLIFTAIICIIMGMGLPTTANYIVVANLMAPVVQQLAKQNGIEIPLIAIHLFVFYFGIMADITPPVGLASFAAAAVSGGKPFATGIIAFVYSIRTVILPFIFIFNTDLLLIGIDTVSSAMIVFFKATFAMLIFAAATQGYMLVKSKKYETVILLLISLTIFRPGFWVNLVTPEYKKIDVLKIESEFDKLKLNESIKMSILGQNLLGEPQDITVYVKADENLVNSDEKLKKFGLDVVVKNNKVIIDRVHFFSQAADNNLYFDYEITKIQKSQPQISKNWIYLVAFTLFIVVFLMQHSRKAEILRSKTPQIYL